MEQTLTRRDLLRIGLCSSMAAGLWPNRLWARQKQASAVAPSHLHFIEKHLTVLYRSEWTGMVPTWERMRPARSFDRITIHHLGASSNFHTKKDDIILDLHGVLDSHHSRRYGDIAYHLVLDYTGRVWEGRSLGYEGAHVSGENSKNIGIMLLGNFEKQRPSEKQRASLRNLTRVLCEAFHIQKHRIYGHRELGASRCPGKHLYADVDNLKKEPEKKKMK